MGLVTSVDVASPCVPTNNYPTDNPHLAAKSIIANETSVAIKGVYLAVEFFPPPLTRNELKGVIVAKLDGVPIQRLNALDYVDKEFTFRLKHLSNGKHSILVVLVRDNTVVNGFSACIEIPGNVAITHFANH